MSVIGPRPALWNQDVLIAEREKYHANDVKPGLTGWAQINGRDELEIPVKAKLDGEYVEKESLLFDIKCFLGTIGSVLSSDGVVEGGTGELTKAGMPYGKYDKKSIKLLTKNGNYKFFFASFYGHAKDKELRNKLLPRIGISNEDSLDIFEKKLQGKMNWKGSIQKLRLQCYLVMLLISGFILFGKEFIALWAGKDYSIAYAIVLVLIIPAAIPNMQSIGVLIMQAMNKHQFRAILYLICAILNVCMSIPAGIKYGPLGCAVCTGITTFLTSGMILNWYYNSKIGLDIKQYWKSIGGQCIKTIPIFLVGMVFNYYITDYNWMSFFMKVICFSLCYIIYIYLVTMNHFEKNFIKEIFAKIRIR